MKRNLIAALIAVAALVSTSALAGVNPHILEVHLGPGGFVAKGGWKKITLEYSGPAPLRLRLNWNSANIAVYTDTNATVAIPNEKEWDVEHGAIMPTNLWVKGLAVSASGPTSTTLGPEHMCLEAINNGTDYVTPLYARTEFTVVAVDRIEYCRKDLDSTVAANWVTDTNVAAGAKDTDVHKAKIRVTIKPVAAGVSMVVTNSGGIGDAIACTLLPLASQLTDANGQIFCDYKSSDKVEGMNAVVTSLADWNMRIDLDSTLSNKWDISGQYDFKCPPCFVADFPDDVSFYPTLEGAGGVGGIDSHSIVYYTEKIKVLLWTLDFSTDTYNEEEVEEVYPDYWYLNPPADMPTTLKVEDLVNHSATTANTNAIYTNTQTVHDYINYDDATDKLTVVYVESYDFGVYDLDVWGP